MRIISYNIHGFVGKRGTYRPERPLQVIEALEPDIVALQEVLADDRQGLAMLNGFCADRDYRLILGPTVRKSSEHQYGNALLVPATPDMVVLHDISLPKREPRGVIECILRFRGERWDIFATHLGLNPRERRLQTKRLLTIIQSRPRENIALLGDINEWFNWGRPLRWLRAFFKGTRTPPTFPARWPVLALDRIWVRSGHRGVRFSTCRTGLCRRSSDHLPLIADVDE